MAKPIQYYVLVRGYHYRTGRGFKVLGVTSEKGRQVYGRDPDTDAATHVAAHDVIHRFPADAKLEFAKAATQRADEEYARHQIGIEQARAELSRLEDLRNQRTLMAAKGELPLAEQPLPGIYR